MDFLTAHRFSVDTNRQHPEINRGGRTRTGDPLLPKQTRVISNRDFSHPHKSHNKFQQLRCNTFVALTYNFTTPMVTTGASISLRMGALFIFFTANELSGQPKAIRGSVCGSSQKHVKQGRLELGEPLEATVCRSMRYKQFDKGVPRMELNAITVCPEIHSEQHLVSTTERSHLSGLLHLLACL